MTDLKTDTIPTPLGELKLWSAPDETLYFVDFSENAERAQRLLARRFGSWQERRARLGAGERLSAYFEGDVEALDGLRVSTGGTPFQAGLWQEMRSIAPGETLSYGALAARLGRPSAARAIGAACGLNPVAIVLPCHRVVGASGALTGYAGGMERKRWLLGHEREATARAGSGQAPAA